MEDNRSYGVTFSSRRRFQPATASAATRVFKQRLDPALPGVTELLRLRPESPAISATSKPLRSVDWQNGTPSRRISLYPAANLRRIAHKRRYKSRSAAARISPRRRRSKPRRHSATRVLRESVQRGCPTALAERRSEGGRKFESVTANCGSSFLRWLRVGHRQRD